MHEIENILSKELKLIKKKKYKHAIWLYVGVLVFFTIFTLAYNVEYNQNMKLDELVIFHTCLAFFVTFLYVGAIFMLKFLHIDEHVVKYHTNRLLKERKERQERIEHEERLKAAWLGVDNEIAEKRAKAELAIKSSTGAPL